VLAPPEEQAPAPTGFTESPMDRLPSSLSRGLRASATAIVPLALALLLLAPAASALEISLARAEAFDLGDVVRIRTEIQVEKVRIDIFGGGSMDFEKIVRTIDFREGPVAVTRFERRGLLDVRVQTAGDDTFRRLSLARGDEPLRIERVQLRGLAFDTPALAGSLRLELAPARDRSTSAPVPEPGAALLFGAGLVAVASARSARRR